MKISGRSFERILRAAKQPQQYRAIANLFRLAPRAPQLLLMYVFGRGRYPRTVRVRTPIGFVTPTLYSHHDLLTLSEVFFRMDYKTGPETTLVVDLGSNIGLSALYFLSRGSKVRCHLVEPVPANVARLRANLSGYRDRWTVYETAVDVHSGTVAFGTEETGRYGGIGKATGHVAQLPCRGISELLQEILDAEGHIDVLKIDTEGAEARTVAAIEAASLTHINTIYMEAPRDGDIVHLDGFSKEDINAVYRFTRLR